MINQPLKPMLLHKSSEVPTGDRFIHQLKFDGHRAIVHYDANRIKIFTRNQNECTAQYPELHTARLNAINCILDGEMVVLNKDDAKPCFESVMERFQAKKSDSIRRLANAMPATFVAFDILYLNGESIMHLPLQKRLKLLQEVVEPGSAITVCPTVDNGENLFEAVKRAGLEGIVSKDKNSTYKLDTRSQNWLKVKNYLYDVVQICGIRKEPFGWILQKNGSYVGVAEFVPPTERQAFRGIAHQLVTSEDGKVIHLEPRVSCKVKFQCYTKYGLMRSPAVTGFVI